MNNKKNYLYNLSSGLSGTIISSILGLITVPIALRYWGDSKYGVWILLTQMVSYLSVSNLGINTTATILMTKNPSVHEKLKIFRMSLKLMLTFTTGIFLLIVFMYIKMGDFNFILGKVDDGIIYEAQRTLVIMGIFFFINLPFSLVTSICQSFQKMYVDNLFYMINVVFSFLNLILVIQLKMNLIEYAVINGIISVLLNLFKAIYIGNVIKKIKVNYLDTNNSENSISYKELLTISLRFFVIGISSFAIWNFDFIIIGNYLGSKEVALYSIAFKLFQFIFVFLSYLSSSLIPIFGREFGLNNWDWIKNTYNTTTLIFSMIGGLTWLGSLLFFKEFIYIWAGKTSFVGIVPIFFLGAYSYLISTVNLNSGIINSFNYTKGTYLISIIEASIKIISSIVLIKILKSSSALAIATFLSSILCVFWILPLIIKKKSKNKIIFEKKLVRKHFFKVLLPFLGLSVTVQMLNLDSIYRLGISLIILCSYAYFSYILVPKDVKKILSRGKK